MNIKLSILMSLLMVSLHLKSQDFQSNDFVVNKTEKAIVKMQDGSAVIGFFQYFDYQNQNLKNVGFLDLNNKKLEIFADDIKFMYLPIESDFYSTNETFKIFSVDSIFVSTEKSEYVFFENIKVMQNNIETSSLLQLLSDNEYHHIRVYGDPQLQNDKFYFLGSSLQNVIKESYYIKKGENPAYIVTKHNYKNQFNALFGDCPKLLQHYKRKYYRQFNDHVNFYNKNCQK